jgi:hypothetical protein
MIAPLVSSFARTSTLPADETKNLMSTKSDSSAGNAPAFTPGPWSLTLHRTNPRNFLKVEAPASLRVICDAFSHSDEDLANARLIAAAPELLAALRTLEAAVVLRGINGFAQEVSAARSAICKAEGRL